MSRPASPKDATALPPKGRAAAAVAVQGNSPGPKLEQGKTVFIPKYRPFERCRDVSNYEKLKKIGQGTFGEVHKAQERATGDIVALKKVLMTNEQEGFPITAIREIKILALMNHQNVLRIKEIVQYPANDYNRQTGSIFLVFEYMDHDLGGLLNRGIEFTAPEIMCISKQLLDGMHYIHAQKVLHRDMKVANILMNNRGVIKIADFGLARGHDAKNSRYTSTVCTRWYRPPEILLGERNYTYAIDIWGVGCIVAELFVGRPILQGGVPDAVDEAENDLDQYIKICQLCGTPSAATWKDFDKLPMGRFAMPKEMYEGTLHDFLRPKVRGVRSAITFIDSLLTLDPSRRPTASAALDHNFFWGGDAVDGKTSDPMPCKPDQIRFFPSSHEGTTHRRVQGKPPGIKAVQVKQVHVGGVAVPDKGRPGSRQVPRKNDGPLQSRLAGGGGGRGGGQRQRPPQAGHARGGTHHQGHQQQRPHHGQYHGDGHRLPDGHRAVGQPGQDQGFRHHLAAARGSKDQSAGSGRPQARPSVWATSESDAGSAGGGGGGGSAAAAGPPKSASVWATGGGGGGGAGGSLGVSGARGGHHSAGRPGGSSTWATHPPHHGAPQAHGGHTRPSQPKRPRGDDGYGPHSSDPKRQQRR